MWIKEADTNLIFTEEDNKKIRNATLYICDENIWSEKSGRQDHLSNMKDWMILNGLDLRKIPTEKELKKSNKDFQGNRYTWDGKNVIAVKKKGKRKVEITYKNKEGVQITTDIKRTDLIKTLEYRIFMDQTLITNIHPCFKSKLNII